MLRRFDAVPIVDRTALRRLSAPAASYTRVATVLQVIASALSVVPLFGIWLIADAAFEAHSAGTDARGRIYMGIGLVCGAAIVGFLLTSCAYYATHTADLQVRRSVRSSVADHLGRLPLGWFDSGASEKALATLGEDVEALHSAVAHGRLELIQSFVAPVIAVAWLLTVDWRLTLIMLIPTGVHYIVQQRIILRAQSFQAQQGAAISALVSAANEEMRDAVTLRITSAATTGTTRLLTAQKKLHQIIVDSHLEQESRGSKIAALTDPVFALFVALFAGYWLIQDTTRPPTDLVPFVVAAVIVAAAPSAITLARWGVVSAAMAATRIEGILAVVPLSVSDRPLRPTGDEIQLTSVAFGYGVDPVLSDVTLGIEQGSFTAIVGPSGSGKSTICSLIGRHHDVTQGQVTIGGVDVREIDPAHLNRTVALLPQQAVLLRTTVRDNIRLAHPDSDDAVVVAAARTANIHDRILALPQGYDTVVGDDITLSSGECQRVAIARALVSNPRILILDEPTAHVDPESAIEIHAALGEIVRDRTVILIAHQLDSVVGADRIVVVETGNITATGTHSELIETPGVYREMWEAAPQPGRQPA
ncbi:ATP-binding cassette subfamily B protein [Rhodococcus erythropolis]|uniref:ABC transporter ATP-binding protein n=1 Tax=Rhodococcus erythropolis TaxID=1833 RepID=UPI00216732E3|nr:ABC transporter ATP-binding protein [Rhodococcus erythropolis]MCS4255805.1 ATP-binding cassette subfamily B protein [Rhodococcus erythropolis]MCW2425322.1 ATP-binding cassette subfamily B protein [Rhodococcus erythropolis]